MATFHPLTVTDVTNTIRDAVVVTLQPSSAGDFDFIQGQYLTFRRQFGDEEVRRSYSICAGLDDGMLQVGIKKVDGGAFSTWANEHLRAGDVLEAMSPMGSFHVPLNEQAHHRYLAFAGGSGITPVLSIMKTVLAREPESRFTLVYANRAVNTIMFRSEIDDLKNLYMSRLNIIHVLESDAQDIDLFRGRIDAEKCTQLFSQLIDISSITHAFICGPEPMMLAIAGALKAHGLTDSQIKFELFAGSTQQGRIAQRQHRSASSESENQTSVKVTLNGESRSYSMSKDQCLLESALQNNLDAPYACRAGVCSTCRARVLDGEVEMQANHALEDHEVERGYVLTCQCYPISDTVVFDYDQ